MNNGNKLAFPHEDRSQGDMPDGNYFNAGLSKREYFTAMALAGLCATDLTKDATAKLAVEIADLTLAELNKQP